MTLNDYHISKIMVDSNSPVFNYSEKIGLIIGKVIRYIVVSEVIIFIGRKLGGSKTSQPVTNPPPTAPPSF
jgi:hypothetical protein